MHEKCAPASMAEMAVADIQPEVWNFIETHIDTVPQLEALLLIYGTEDRPWKTEEIATRIYVALESARDILEALRRRSLIVLSEDSLGYRRSPATDATTALIATVSHAYRRHLIPIATFIHSKASASVREFARAFEIKKDR